jgi:Leucine-rich repeat (LRR) protein
MKYVRVKDFDLGYALRQVVGSDLTDESLLRVEELDRDEYRAEAGEYWKPVYDLTGIEHCLNLRKLGFDGNGVKSLGPLAGLVRLEELWLVQNQVSNLKPLAGLSNLKTLVLELNTRLKSVAPLAGLASLEYLNIAGTGVRDLAPLVDLPALSSLAWGPPSTMPPADLRRADRVIDTLRTRGVVMKRYGRLNVE